MTNYHFNWTTLCGSPDFYVWNSNFHNFELCFQKLVLECVAYFLLAVTSAYYIGRRTPWTIRDSRQKTIITCRTIAASVCLIIAILEPWASAEAAKRKLYWVDISSTFCQVFAWAVHLWFLHVLKYRVTRGTRGPTPVILAWFSTLFFSICYARAAWSDVFNDIDNKELFIPLFRLLTGMHLGFQMIYLCSLFPRGFMKRTQFRDVFRPEDEASGSESGSYSRMEELVDPQELGAGEERFNFLSRLTFSWVNPLMEKGKNSRLRDVNDMFRMPSDLQTEHISNSIQRQIMIHQPLDEREETHVPKEPYYLFKALFRCFGGRFLKLGIIKLCSDIVSFGGPLLLHEVVRFVEGKEPQTWKGYLSGVGLVTATITGVLLSTHYQWLLEKLNLQVRASVETSIFKKIQQLKSSQFSKVSHGEMVNMMTTDADRIVRFSESFHAFWSMPFTLCVTLALLYTQIGVAFLVGLGITIIVVPINRILAVQIAKYSTKMMKHKDKRVNLMTEIIGMIKAVKLNALEGLLWKNVMTERDQEMEGLAGRKYLDAGCVYLWATTPVIVPIATFGTYVALGNPMDPARIFTAVALFGMLITPLNAFPWVINGIVESWVSIKRVEKLMSLEENDPNSYYTVVAEMSSPENDVSVLIDKGSFAWEEEQTDEETHRRGIKEVQLQIPKGKIVGVVGSVGSGKTTLLNAIMAEVIKEEGIVAVSNLHEGFGYVSQTPWLQNTTIRENIIFGQAFNKSKYEQVVSVCCLEEDLREFALRDQTRCGENGSSLSGGQKARVALARAIYQNKSLYLLDDIFSALDEPVAEHIIHHCIHGLLEGKTVILVSHNLRMLTRVDSVVQVQEGKITRQGTPKEILPQLTQEDIFKNDWASKLDKTKGAVPRTKKVNFIKCPSRNFTLRVNEQYLTNEEVEESEIRSFGQINSDVYLGFLIPIGAFLFAFFFTIMLLMQASRNLADVWLAQWVSHSTPPINSNLENLNFTSDILWSSHLGINSGEHLPNALYRGNNYAITAPMWDRYYQLKPSHRSSVDVSDPTTKFYLTIYILIAVSNSVLAFARSFVYAYLGLKISTWMHGQLLDAILYAKMSFFDVNPLGRIINRFSSDICSIDDTLPFQLNIFLAQILGLLGALVVTMYGIPWILLVYIPLFFLYVNIQQYYRHTSRELRRIFSLTLSPMYNHFSETINGLHIIKAMRAGHRFSVQNESYLNANQTVQYNLKVTSVWLNFRLQLIGVVVIIGVTILSLFKNTKEGISPGLVGLVISYSLTMSGFLNGVVTYLTETEREMISAERVAQYVTQAPNEREHPGNPRNPNPPLALPRGWPTRGKITFDNVYFRYHDHNPFALRGISMEIPAGATVGIQGRTGSGKTSILMALFRMSELSQGRIAIDNVDVADVHLKKLRSTMAIVSQDILIFTGTVRDNLDLRSMNTDIQIWMAIDQCELRHLVENLGGLDGTLTQGGADLSAGQRQLFCLARVLLSKAKIICIDEGTSLLDNDTDMLMQRAIKRTFRDNTVIIVAHRTESLRNCDMILTMENGEIKDLASGIEDARSRGAVSKFTS